jgi:hypothetical protein
MRKRLSHFLALCCVLLLQPLQAVAQQAPAPSPPPQWYGPGSWYMWGYGWPFWWICPLMMLGMVLVMGAVFFMRRSSADGPARGDSRA